MENESEEKRSGEKGSEEAIFDGYVAESTDTRVRLTGAAVEIWEKDLKTILFGVGLGGAGQALYVNGLSSSPKEIVQNEYASLLLENGIVGIALLILTIVLIIRVVIKSQLAPMMLALIVAYVITLLFFSGLPNVLQIYLLPVLLWAFWKEKSSKRNQ
jgi:O-antigen ligase